MNTPNRPRLGDIRTMPIGEIAALPAYVLALLQGEAEESVKAARHLADWLNGAIALRYGERAAAIRLTEGKDTGTVRFDDGDCTIVADLSKKVEWDQTQLATLVSAIRAEYGDPAEYVDTVIRVPERKYAAWPRHIRTAFERARTVRPGKLRDRDPSAGGSHVSLPIITADQRLAEPRGIKGCIFGKSGLGKTSLLWTLNASTTLFFDLEAGDLAIEGWEGDAIRPRTWTECRDFAVFIGGPNPALRQDQSYSQAHYDAVCTKFGDPAVLDRYDTIFIDSITVAGRLCFQWCKGQPEALSEKTGKPDVRGAYGLHGREMIGWLTHLQHTRAKNVWFVGILDERLDDFNRKVFSPQIDGSKTGLELPGIVDQVITMAELPDANGKPGRAFVCHTLNPWGFPAKDRSGRLDMVEAPHLGRLMEKVHGPVQPAPLRLTYTPLAPPAAPSAAGDTPSHGN